MNKKNYISPAAKEVTLLAMQMLASSEQIRIVTDQAGGEQLSNGRRDGWSDPWSE